MDTQFLEYLKYMNILTSSDILGVGLISEQILALQSWVLQWFLNLIDQQIVDREAS